MRLLIIFLFVMLTIQVNSQQTISNLNYTSHSVAPQRCQTTEIHNHNYSTDQSYRHSFDIRKVMLDSIRTASLSQARLNCTNAVIIPVAVHYEGVSSQTAACLEQLALTQIAALNADYSASNSDISNYCNDVANSGLDPNALAYNGTCIQFCLANQNHPSGFGLNNGDYAITINEGYTNFSATWSGYLNMFIQQGTGVLGYSPLFGNANGSGVVIEGCAFGIQGNGCGNGIGPGTGCASYSVYNLGRTVTHEVGHYLGLNHIWGDGGCAQDDGFADTPTAGGEYYGCPAQGSNSCGSDDMYMNYMDYVNDACMYMFSENQANLMYNTAQNINWASNKCSSAPSYPTAALPSGCNPASNDAGVIAHISPVAGSSTCAVGTSITPEVTIQNFGSNILTSAIISYEINSGAPVTYSWTGALATGATENVMLTPYNEPAGIYTFDSYTVNPNGSPDDDPSNDQFSSNHQTVVLQSLPYQEDFEDGSFDPTNSGLVSINNDGDAFAWAQANVSANGIGSYSAFFDNFNDDGNGNNPGGTIDALATPVFDFSTVTGAQLTFDVAYAQYDATYTDSLLVLVSTDCGNLFDQNVFFDGSTGLATAPDVTTLFTPTSTQWNNIVVDLSAYDGAANVSIAIVNFSGYGNAMYIDNININTSVNATCSVTTSATPVSCAGNDGSVSTTSNAGPNPVYNWSNGMAGSQITGLSEGVYTVTLSDDNGCVFSATATVANGCVTPGVGCDTISNFAATDTPILYNSDNTGYVSGHNGYGDIAKADYYNYAGTNTDIKGTYIGFGPVVASTPAASFNVNVWDGTGGTPGAVLYSFPMLYQDAVPNTLQFIEFPTTVAVPASNEFFVGIEFAPGTGADTVSIITNTSGEMTAGTGTAWEQWSDNTWNNYNSATSWGLDLAHSIYPVLGIQPTASFTPNNQTVCIGDVITFNSTSIDATSYYWEFPGGSPANSTSANPTVTYTSTGSYDVTFIAYNDCMQDSITMTNIITVTEIFSTATATDESCAGNDGTASAVATGGSNYVYNWSNGGMGATINGLTAGTYTVTITDTNGCTSTTSAVVGNACNCNGFVVTAQSVNASCNGVCDGTAIATATGGDGNYSYSWSTGDNSSALSNLCAGTYTVTASDASGCSASQTVTITEPAGISITTASTAETCAGNDGTASVTSVGIAVFTYSWSNGTSGTNISGLTAGSYTVTVTDINTQCFITETVIVGNDCGCDGSLSFQVGNIIQAGCDGECNGAIISNISVGGTAPYTYLWSNGSTSSDIINLCADVYSVTVTDAAQCTASALFTIGNSNSLNIATSSTAETCAGNDGTASVTGVGNYTYIWSNGSSGNLISGLDEGIYTVTATDTNGCTATSTTTVLNDCGCNITVTATSTATSCAGQCDGTIVATAFSPITVTSYAWSNGANGSTISNLCAGTYTVTATDIINCTATFTVIVEDAAAMNLIVNGNDANCGDGSGSVSVNVIGGSSPFTYAWNTGDTDNFVSGLNGGNYAVTATDSNGCTSTGTVTISQTSSMSLSGTTVDVTCNGDANGAVNVTVTGGTPPYSYDWNDGTTTEDLNGQTAGNYVLLVTDANNCSTGSSFSISEPPAISVNMTVIDASNGSNGSILAGTSGGVAPYTWQWSNGATGIQNSNLSAGDYFVTVTDANGCITTASATVQDLTNTFDPSVVLDWSVTPNPSNGIFNLNMEMAQFEEVSVKVINVLGQTMYQKEYNGNSLTDIINVSQLAQGTYFLEIRIRDNRVVEKLMIVR